MNNRSKVYEGILLGKTGEDWVINHAGGLNKAVTVLNKVAKAKYKKDDFDLKNKRWITKDGKYFTTEEDSFGFAYWLKKKTIIKKEGKSMTEEKEAKGESKLSREDLIKRNELVKKRIEQAKAYADTITMPVIDSPKSKTKKKAPAKIEKASSSKSKKPDKKSNSDPILEKYLDTLAPMDRGRTDYFMNRPQGADNISLSDKINKMIDKEKAVINGSNLVCSDGTKIKLSATTINYAKFRIKENKAGGKK